jgi:UDP-N-acetylglucosamine 2-epimerase (non-hydrolysing)
MINRRKLNVLTVIGTRPEAIKMAPLIAELRRHPDDFTVHTCATAQHRDMLDQVLELFEVEVEYDLNLMRENQTLFDVMANALKGLDPVLTEVKPDIVLAQGDTTTTFIASLAGFLHRAAVGHIEAGLRTYDKYSPFPEEANRRMTSAIATWHFAPTNGSRDNLLRENVPAEDILVTGNTVIDALLLVAGKKCDTRQAPFNLLDPTKRLILMTAHRRESFGESFRDLCNAVADIVARNDDVEVVYPVHPNPNVQQPVREILGNVPRVHLIAPLDYFRFVHLMKQAYLILTDSGGVQEEAPSLGKPVLVMRDTTERPEGIEAGTVKLVGTDRATIVRESQRLLDDRQAYEHMATAANPYGDGKASQRIVEFLLQKGTAR